jgi:hypothetical protein
MISRVAWVAAGAVLCLCTACGTGGEAARTAATRFLGAVDQGDDQAACGLLAPPAAESLTADGTACGDALTELDLPTDRAVQATSVWSDRAQVRTAADVLFLVEQPDGWRIAAAGCTRQPDETYRCLLEEQ